MPTTDNGCTRPSDVFMNEIHYDNLGNDQDEGVELTGLAGVSITNWRLVAYSGADGSKYSTTWISGTFSEGASGHGFLWVTMSLQNGAPDGIALIDSHGAVVEFLCYEGEFIAADGPARGRRCRDLRIAESSSQLTGKSLQLTGRGSQSEDFKWGRAIASRGSINVGQSFNRRSCPYQATTTVHVRDLITVVNILVAAAFIIRMSIRDPADKFEKLEGDGEEEACGLPRLAVRRDCPQDGEVRELLIFACVPGNLDNAIHEAIATQRVTGWGELAHVHMRNGKVCGTADDLRRALGDTRTRRFLFIGHGDVQVQEKPADVHPQGQPANALALAFTEPDGTLSVVEPNVLVDILCAHVPKEGGALEMVFLNGCVTEPLGQLLRARGVPVVICWRTLLHDDAARIFSQAFFRAYGNGQLERAAFEDAARAITTETKPGMLAYTGHLPSNVQKYELRDPKPKAPASPEFAGLHPPPEAAGIPVLLCAEGDAERVILPSGVYPKKIADAQTPMGTPRGSQATASALTPAIRRDPTPESPTPESPN